MPAAGNGGKMVRRFHLTRVYSLISLVGIGAIAVALNVFYNYFAVGALEESATEANTSVARVLANTLWPEYGHFIEEAATLSPADLAQHPDITRLNAEVRHQVRGMQVVKVKIYDLNGLTVFSSDTGQIGESRADSPGFIAAVRGQAASELKYKDTFSTWEQEIADRNLLASYVPVYAREDGPVTGVFEIYTDVTPLYLQIQHDRLVVVAAVTGSMLLLYFFLLAFIRRADHNMRDMEAEERNLQQEKLRYLVHHDGLTHLPNREMGRKLLRQALSRASDSKQSVALLLLGLDRFKLLNDGLGHVTGDLALIHAAEKLSEAMADKDTVYRVTGDQFGIILENIPNATSAAVQAESLIESIAFPFQLQDQEILLSASIGIALYPDDGSAVDELLRHAEAALHRAKALGRGRHAFYTEELNASAFARLEQEMALRNALNTDQLQLRYQPKVDVRQGRVTGVESLLQWHHPEWGTVPASEFVPLLEETGLILRVGEWAIGEALRQCRKWHDAGYSHMSVAVNVSAHQFHSPTLMQAVREALEETGLPAQALELELTESVLAEDTETALTTLNQFKALGIKLSIDDFGTGYSSLSYLMHFPIDTLKIDRSFIRDMMDNQEHAILTHTIVSLTKNLCLGVVAEGVENEQQLAFLMELGCEVIQGYLFSAALPAEQCIDRFAAIAKHCQAAHYSDRVGESEALKN